MHSYLLASSPEIVRIDDNSDTWIWRNNDSTAAFAGQLAEILENIASLLNGLPTITSILCVASALRHWESDAVWNDRLRNMIPQTVDTDSIVSKRPQLVRWLSKIASQKEALRTGTIATVSVFGCGLAGHSNLLEITDRKAIDEIIHFLRLSSEDREPFTPAYFVSDAEFHSHCLLTWQTLLHLSENAGSTEEIENWRKTGLRDLPRTSDGPETLPPQSIHETIKSLEEDEIYGGLARYSRQLSGLISLPRRVADPDDMPLGGVSDVTNRGNPEQLLMTELAADPLVLLARIANGQALYMRKESPPAVQWSVRPVLVESSIQCWGLPRVRMAALALAVATAEQRRARMDTMFFLLESDRYLPIDGSCRDGLFKLIECLDTGEHPGKALLGFMNDRSDQRQSDCEQAEPLLIISAATWRNPEFVPLVQQIQQPFLAAIIDKEGMVKIVRRTALGQEPLQTLKLELADEHTQTNVRPNSAKPMFILQPSPPLTFSPAGREVDWLADEHANGDACVWMITQDQRLLRFTSAFHGGEEVIDALPRGTVFLSYVSHSRLELVLAQRNKKHCWVRVEAGARTLQHKVIGNDGPEITYAVSGPFLLRFVRGTCNVFRRSDGEPVASYKTNRRHVGFAYQTDDDHSLWTHGGGAPDDWHCLGRIGLDAIESGTQKLGGVIFNYAGIWGVTDDLRWMVELRKPDQTTTPKVTAIRPIKLGQAPCDARPLLANLSANMWVFEASFQVNKDTPGKQGEKFLCKIDFDAQLYSSLYTLYSGDLVRSVFPKAYQLVRKKPLRRRASAVLLTASGIIFEKDKSTYYKLSIAQNNPSRLTVASCECPPDKIFAAFGEPYKTEDNPHQLWTLRRAEIQGGFCWADSRGLFHFKRNDHSDELTLAFSDNHVAGWFSGFGQFGPKYFFPPSAKKRDNVPLPLILELWLKQWFQQAT